MIYKQEEISPIENWYFDRLQKPFGLVEERSLMRNVDTDELKEFCSMTMDRLREFQKYIEKLEREARKKKAQEAFEEGFDD